LRTHFDFCSGGRSQHLGAVFRNHGGVDVELVRFTLRRATPCWAMRMRV
jgi:hypothetical protein